MEQRCSERTSDSSTRTLSGVELWHYVGVQERSVAAPIEFSLTSLTSRFMHVGDNLEMTILREGKVRPSDHHPKKIALEITVDSSLFWKSLPIPVFSHPGDASPVPSGPEGPSGADAPRGGLRAELLHSGRIGFHAADTSGSD